MSTARPRLLVLTPRYPYPVVGGDRLRIYQVCKALSQRIELTLLSLCENADECRSAMPDDGVFSSVERVLLPRWRSWLQCALALPTDQPLQVAYYRSASFRQRLDALAPRHQGVLAHLIRTGESVRRVRGPARFLEMTDAISLNYSRVQRSRDQRGLRARIFALEAGRLARYERQVVDDFDRSFLVSDVDRQHLFGDSPARLAKVMVCSNGVDLDRLPYGFDAAGRDLVFIGNMTTLQNLDAALFAASEILPRILRSRPDCRLRIVGRIREADAAQLRRHPGVVVTGEVGDIALAVQGGAVGICPMRLGAGVQNKVLEYLALGLPTVTTQIGLEGFAATPGSDLWVADDAGGFADKALMLLENRNVAEATALAGRRYVEARHSWSAMLEPMVTAIVDSLQARSDR